MEIYDKIWEDYVNLYDKFTFDIQEEVLQFVAANAYGNVIDAGAGVGKLFPFLFKNKEVNKILGIEKNSLMRSCSYSKTLKKDLDKVKIIPGDVCLLDEYIPFDFPRPDVICSINVLYTLENPEIFLNKAYNVLKKGGHIIISSPNKNVDFNGKILPHISSSFKGDFVDKENFDKFVDINKTLVNTSENIPKVYSLKEIRDLLEDIGFEVEFESDYYYLGCNFTVVAKKS